MQLNRNFSLSKMSRTRKLSLQKSLALLREPKLVGNAVHPFDYVVPDLFITRSVSVHFIDIRLDISWTSVFVDTLASLAKQCRLSGKALFGVNKRTNKR